MGGNLDDVVVACRLPGLGGAGCVTEVLECLSSICGPLAFGITGWEVAPAVSAWACKPAGKKIPVINGKTSKNELAGNNRPIRIATLVGRTGPSGREQATPNWRPFFAYRKNASGPSVHTATLPAEGSPQDYPAGLLAWGSHSGPPSRDSGGIMDRRPPIQLRGSAGFAPASRAPDMKVYYTAKRQESNPANSTS